MWGHQAAQQEHLRKLEGVVSSREVGLWDLGTSGYGDEVREDVREHQRVLSHQGCVTNMEHCMQGGRRGSGRIRTLLRTWAFGYWCPS